MQSSNHFLMPIETQASNPDPKGGGGGGGQSLYASPSTQCPSGAGAILMWLM